MELGDVGFAGDQQAPPDQRAHATEYGPKLIDIRKVQPSEQVTPYPLALSEPLPRNLPVSSRFLPMDWKPCRFSLDRAAPST